MNLCKRYYTGVYWSRIPSLPLYYILLAIPIPPCDLPHHACMCVLNGQVSRLIISRGMSSVVMITG